jgi:hypothetical protein
MLRHVNLLFRIQNGLESNAKTASNLGSQLPKKSETCSLATHSHGSKISPAESMQMVKDYMMKP